MRAVIRDRCVAVRLDHLARTGLRAAREVILWVGRLERSAAEPQVVDGRSITVRQAERESAVLGPRIDAERGSRRYDRRSSVRRFVGRGLLVVNAAAFVLTAAVPRPPGVWFSDAGVVVAVVVLAVLAIGTQAAVAVQLGRCLWTHRHADQDGPERTEMPPRDAAILVGGGTLAVAGVFTGAAHYLWVQERVPAVDPQIAVALGLAVAVSAWVAPWLVVADLAHGPSPERERLGRLSSILRRVEHSRGQLRARVEVSLTLAEAQLATSQRVLAAARDRTVAAARPSDHLSWSLPVEQLASAVSVARRAYDRLTGPGGPLDPIDPLERGDVDLAG